MTSFSLIMPPHGWSIDMGSPPHLPGYPSRGLWRFTWWRAHPWYCQPWKCSTGKSLRHINSRTSLIYLWTCSTFVQTKTPDLSGPSIEFSQFSDAAAQESEGFTPLTVDGPPPRKRYNISVDALCYHCFLFATDWEQWLLSHKLHSNNLGIKMNNIIHTYITV